VNYAQHELGGITRKIYLFAVPSVNIAALHTETRFDDRYRDATLRINATIANEDRSVRDRAIIRFDLTDPQGQRVPLRPEELPLRRLAAGGNASGLAEIPVAAPQHWENEHPRLYKLRATLVVDGHATETIERRIGFRQVEIRGNQLLLNGHAIKLHGVERHETNPLLGRSLKPDIWKREVQLLHEANMNYVFTSHYPVPEEFLDLCDEAGILVTEEVPQVWVGIPGMNELTDGNENPKYYATSATVASTLIEKDRDHPSIIFWQSCDECRWGRNAGALLRLFKASDPGRPVNFSYEANTSMFFSQHYPSLDDARSVPAHSVKGYIFDQYTHINNYNRREVLTDPGLREYYANAIGPMWETMYANPGIIGGAIWEWSDDIFEAPPSGLDLTRFHGDFDSAIGRWKVGYGPWGIVDSWLRKKPEFWHVKKAYSPIRIQEDFRFPSPADGDLEIPVENRYDFTNLSEVRIEWSTATRSGETTADVPPRSKGAISLRLPEGCAGAGWLELKFFRQGELVDAYRFESSATPKPDSAMALRASQSAPLLLEQTGRMIRVRGKNFYWQVDRSNGMVSAGPSGQSAVIMGGPALAITPAEMSPCCPQLDGPVEPLQPIEMPWKVSEVGVREEGNAVVVVESGSYQDASGTYEMHFEPGGQATVTYHFQYNGPDLLVREIGLLFDVPAVQNTIRWRRKGFWSWYPDGHIGRMEGSASAFRSDQAGPRVPGAEPPRWPWEQDSTAAGTNDFRATKFNIFEASLADSAGHGIAVVNSAGRQSVRAWVDQTRIRMLVADFYNGGSEPFLRTNHYALLQRTLHKGDVLSGSVTLALRDGDQ
jgi:beta-galactosidase